jgi:hypothetical protein
LVRADALRNDLDVNNPVLNLVVGGQGTVAYRIDEAGPPNSGDDTPGCNAADGSSAFVTLTVPAGVTASTTGFTFNSCGTGQNVTFTGVTPGSYDVIAVLCDAAPIDVADPSSDQCYSPSEIDFPQPYYTVHAALRINVTQAAAAACFLVLDSDAIDNGGAPNNFTASQVNDDIKSLSQRAFLRFFNLASNFGTQINLFSGQVGDEGWFALKTIPASWGATPEQGLANYIAAGPGLGSGSNPEALLDKVPNVTPLRAEGLLNLVGRTCGVLVHDSDVSINYDNPINGSLKGTYLGRAAFRIVSVTSRIGTAGASSTSLPVVRIEIVNPATVFAGTFALLTNGQAPTPTSSSTPRDVLPNGSTAT